MKEGMNREILRIALPAIIANITVPLLGLVDTAIAGHLGNKVFIGAVAVGAMMFNLVYWNFGFLRMSTSGMTAQTCGSGDFKESAKLLGESTALAVLVSAIIIALQWPIRLLLLWIIGPSPEVTSLAITYFTICIWGVPPVLVMMAFKGWLLGMQDSKSAMWISIMTNIFNIGASLICVYLLKMGFVGIAVGTMAGEWLGLLYAALTVQHKFPRLNGLLDWRRVWRFKGAGRYFKVSRDIFVRSFLLMTVSLAFVSIGARSGDLILAVNALILQLFTLYSHFMDGIAFAGEAVVGKYYGMGDMGRMRRCVRLLFGWGLAVATVFTLIYSFPRIAFWLLTDQQSVIEAAMDYRVWCALIPAAGMAAFVWDGVFISLTKSGGMLISASIAWSLFFVIYWLTPGEWGNNRLWIAYLSFLALRGIIQTILYNGYLRSGLLKNKA